LHNALPYHPVSTQWNSRPEQVLIDAAPLGCGMGGPDVYHGAFVNDCYLQRAYNMRIQLQDIVPQFQEVQQNNYLWDCAHSGFAHNRTYSEQVDLIFDFVKTYGLANYMSWQVKLNYIDPAITAATEQKLVDIGTTEHPGDPAGGLRADLPTSLQA